MQSAELRELLEFLAQSHFVEFEMEREGFRLRVLKAAPPAPPAASNGSPAQGGSSLTAGASLTGVPAAPEAAVEEEGLFIVTSPIVGTFYRTPAPDSPPFVELGGRVKKGQVLCIVEAMKLMNEIESDVDGELVEIGVSNGQPVEYGEVLFKIRPSP